LKRKKLPQTIQALVGDIGEQQVLLRFAILAHQCKGWEVFKNIGESGFDILLIDTKTSNRIAIEVKTRQKLYSTSVRAGSVRFFLTKNEYKSTDFVVAYYIDKNWFFIIPKEDLISVSGGKRWRFVLSLNKKGEIPKTTLKYFNAWESISPEFKNLLPK